MMVQRHGGAANRPGTEMITEVKNSLSAVRLIKFERSRDQAYVLELGNLYVRMIRNGAYVSLSGAATAWAFPSFYSPGDTVSAVGINYVNLTGNNPNTAPAANPTDWYPLPGLIYELPTPYVVADLPEIRFAQRSGVPIGGLALDKATILTLTHPSYAPRELSCRGDLFWWLHIIPFVPAIGTPVGPIVFGGGAAGAALFWAVTAISDSGEESLVLTGTGANLIPSVGTPTTLAWSPPVSGYPVTASYRIYRSTDGVSYGFIGGSTGTAFSDAGTIPDMFSPPPGVRTVFDVADKFPTAVSYYQQRLMLANINVLQETIWGSRTAQFTNFSISFPLQDNDAVTFAMVGKQLNAIQHLLDLGRLIVFTSNEEKLVEGDDAGILRPDAINPRKLSANGIGFLRPVEIDDTAIYVQGRGTIVRDLKPISSSSYQGTDLTVWAAHMFNGYTLADCTYAQSPNSILWFVRSDGTLLGLTYLREHDIYGWHHHDTDGIVENVCAIPEGSEDRLYMVVRRVINGVTKRYIERMASRYFVNPEDANFVDCGKTFNAWNVAATTMTLSGGVAWDNTELLTMTASVATFAAGDVGNVVILRILDVNGLETSRIRFTIQGYTSPTVVTGFSDRLVPAGLQATAKTTWALAKKILTGLSHLEGKSVAVLGDGYVVASPNNLVGYPTVVTVVGGQVTLPDAYAIVRVGLPFISDLVTLDIDTPGPATIKDRKHLVNRLGLYLEASRGVWAGLPSGPTTADPLAHLQEYKARAEEDYSTPVAPKTDFIDINIEANWETNARLMVRQVDPLPMTILSITPIGYI